jgi:hypothetical protein
MEVEVPYRLIAGILLIAVIVGLVVQNIYMTPQYPRVDEPFMGAIGVTNSQVKGEAFRTLPEASVLLDFLDSAGRVGQHPSSAERQELELLLSKLGALHQDLLSTDRQVKATLHLPFETAHDRVIVGELCGMCLQQTISSRDLDIIFESWRLRGSTLLLKLCTLYDLSESDVLFAEKQWLALWNKVYSLATTRCLPSLMSPISSVRDAAPYEPEHLKDTRSYDYRYGGLSASGGNGTI